MGALLASQAQNIRVPVCKNALMTVSTENTSMAQYGEQTSFFLCVLPYKDGYHIDIHATFVRANSGLTPQGSARSGAR
jgi:hypothetical protein